ncbi:MAG: hypothetical protein HY519_03650 [Candidatus Aenigmarchaeota archaeon]|nr:hypothetical protein [Candidatus Aenigmarchaeota archaeon]
MRTYSLQMQQLFETENVLLTKRRVSLLKKVAGRVENLKGRVEIPPVTITAGEPESSDLVALESGRRACLASSRGAQYRIDGCSVERALSRDGDYVRHVGIWNRLFPFHGRVLAEVQREMENAEEINRKLAGSGFWPAQEPVAIMHYDKQFTEKSLYSMWVDAFLKAHEKYPELTIFDEERHLELHRKLAAFGKRAMHMRHLRNGELAASVMRVWGDSRLPEVLSQKTLDQEAAQAVAYKIGVAIGAQKKATEGWWQPGNSAKRYVVFAHDGQIHASMTGFEKTVKYGDAGMRSLTGARRGVESFAIQHTLYGVPAAIRTAFAAGFGDGYKDPDRRQPIMVSELYDGFDLKFESYRELFARNDAQGFPSG